MEITVKENKLIIKPTSETDIAFIESRLGCKKGGDSVKLTMDPLCRELVAKKEDE